MGWFGHNKKTFYMPNHGEAIPNLAKGSDSDEISRKLQFEVVRRLYSRFVLVMTISC